jgi:cullin-associated NEDD8-dissociated protein 1
MSPQQDVFNSAIELFASDQEDVRTAAAFAAGQPFVILLSAASSHCASLLGNIAIGNLQLFLPYIVHLVKQDDSKRLLALHALKEVVTHTSTSHLENLAETLWVPLFENSESADESSRGVAAACIGKLITTHPARYLPQVHVCIPEFVMTYVCLHVFRPASATQMLLHERLCCQRSGTLSLTHLLPSTKFWPRT